MFQDKEKWERMEIKATFIGEIELLRLIKASFKDIFKQYGSRSDGTGEFEIKATNPELSETPKSRIFDTIKSSKYGDK